MRPLTNIRRASPVIEGRWRRQLFQLLLPTLRWAQRRELVRNGFACFRKIMVETVSYCNNNCSFCPISVEAGNKTFKLMPREIFDKIIAELSDMRFDGTVALFCNNEPSLDRRMPDLIAAARAQLPRAHLYLMTNGIRLSTDMFNQWFESGLDKLIINNYDDTLAIIPSIRLLVEAYQEGRIRQRDWSRTDINLRRKTQVAFNRAGGAPNQTPAAHAESGFCAYPFTDMVVVTDGSAVLCCFDALWTVVVGNVAKQSLLEVWRGGRMAEVRKALMTGDRSCNAACAQCDYHGVKFTGPFHAARTVAAAGLGVLVNIRTGEPGCHDR